MGMPGRQYSAGNSYRYGFNGKENDDEIHAKGNALDFGNRIYDPRLGRWISIDPLQQRFPNFSPYNYCYDSPLQFIDPDGRLGIYVEVKYNEQTGRYTLLSITINDDLEPRDGKIGTNWHDFVAIYNNPYDVVLNYATTEPLQFKLLSKRTHTVFNWGQNWAKAFVDDGLYEDYGGIMWTSEEGQGEETRKGRADFIDNIDGLLEMVKGGGAMGGELEFDKSENILKFIETLTDLIKEKTETSPGDKVNVSDPVVKKTLMELQKLLADYEDPSQSNQKNNNKKLSSTRKEYIIWQPTEGNQTGWSLTKSPADPSKPDTVIILYHPKDKKKDSSQRKTSSSKKADSTNSKKGF
jgi:RHS repeat-associated protein